MNVCHKRVPFISCLYTWVCERILSVFLRPPPSSWLLLLSSKTIALREQRQQIFISWTHTRGSPLAGDRREGQLLLDALSISKGRGESPRATARQCSYQNLDY